MRTNTPAVDTRPKDICFGGKEQLHLKMVVGHHNQSLPSSVTQRSHQNLLHCSLDGGDQERQNRDQGLFCYAVERKKWLWQVQCVAKTSCFLKKCLHLQGLAVYCSMAEGPCSEHLLAEHLFAVHLSELPFAVHPSAELPLVLQLPGKIHFIVHLPAEIQCIFLLRFILLCIFLLNFLLLTLKSIFSFMASCTSSDILSVLTFAHTVLSLAAMYMQREGDSTKPVLVLIQSDFSPVMGLRVDVFPVPGYPCAPMLVTCMVTSNPTTFIAAL